MREGSGTEVTTLQGGTALNNIDDIRYFRDQVLWTMNIPPEYLGFTSDQSGGSQGRGSLAMQDIKFSKFKRILCGSKIRKWHLHKKRRWIYYKVWS